MAKPAPETSKSAVPGNHAATPSATKPDRIRRPIDVIISGPDAKSRVTVSVIAIPGGGALDIDVTTDAPVTSSAAGHHRVQVDRTGHAQLSVPVTVGTGTRVGYLRATATQGSTTGSVVTVGADTLWLGRAGDGTVLRSRQSSVAVARARAKYDAHGDPAVEKANLAALDRALPGEITRSVQPNTTLPQQVVILGQATYEDTTPNHFHPARQIKIVFTQANPAHTTVETTADDNGNYSLTVGGAEGDDTISGDLSFFAASSYAEVKAESGALPYLLTEPTGQMPAGATVTMSLQALNSGGPASLAFAVHDAFVTAGRYAAYLGTPMDAVDVHFPQGTDHSQYVPPGPLGSGNYIDIGDTDWSDWDVLDHEYGHYVQHYANIGGDVDGDHCISENLSEHYTCDETDSGYGKDKGTKLAWSEGWPSFFGMAGQIVIPSPPVPNVGDTYYDDFSIDSNNHHDTNKDFSISSDPPPSANSEFLDYHGEDNEESVIRFLWDAFDWGPDDHDGDIVGMPDTQMWDLIHAAHPHRLDAAYHALAAGATPAENEGLSCSLSQQRIAPYWGPDSDPNKAPTASIPVGSPPMLSWSAGNGSQKFHNNQFRVEAFDPTTGQAYANSPTLSTTTWTPTLSDWDSMVRGHNDQVYVRVVGWQTDDPQTGPYVGCTRILQIASALVNDSGCAAAALPVGDDSWEWGHIDPSHVNLPFPVNYFGTTYTSLSVNVDGFVTFGGYWWTPNPPSLAQQSFPQISPFRGFVDTGVSGASPVTYSTSAITFEGRPAFCVNWIKVGYSHQNPAPDLSPLDSFQLILVDRSDRASGDFDIVFNYGSMQWEMADYGGGINGLGGPDQAGLTAEAGYSNGWGSYWQLPGSLQPGELIDGGTHALNTHDYNSNIPGRYVFPVHNGQPPIGPGTAISYVGSVAATTTYTSISVTLPTTIAANDLMLMFFTTPSTETVTVPAGWTLANRTPTSFTSLASYVYYKVASSTDHGHNVQVTFATTNRKAVIQILAYRGVDPADPIAFADWPQATTVADTGLQSPSTYPDNPRSWVVTNWTAKSSVITGWDVVGWTDIAQVTRSIVNGSGSGYFNAVTTDSGGPVPTNFDDGAVTALTDHPFGSAVSWTVTLNAAP